MPCKVLNYRNIFENIVHCCGTKVSNTRVCVCVCTSFFMYYVEHDLQAIFHVWKMNRAKQFLLMWGCLNILYLVGLIDQSNYCTSGRTLIRAKAGTTHALGTTTKPAITATAPTTTTTSWKEMTGWVRKSPANCNPPLTRREKWRIRYTWKEKMHLFDISGIR